MEGSLSGRVLMLMIRVKRVTASFMETEKPENVDDFLSFCFNDNDSCPHDFLS